MTSTTTNKAPMKVLTIRQAMKAGGKKRTSYYQRDYIVDPDDFHERFDEVSKHRFLARPELQRGWNISKAEQLEAQRWCAVHDLEVIYKDNQPAQDDTFLTELEALGMTVSRLGDLGRPGTFDSSCGRKPCEHTRVADVLKQYQTAWDRAALPQNPLHDAVVAAEPNF
jgi:hypothetical protein